MKNVNNDDSIIIPLSLSNETVLTTLKWHKISIFYKDNLKKKKQEETQRTRNILLLLGSWTPKAKQQIS